MVIIQTLLCAMELNFAKAKPHLSLVQGVLMWFVNYSFFQCTQQSRAEPQSTECAYCISTNIKAMFDLNEVANLNRDKA